MLRGPGKTTYTFSVTLCFQLRPFSVLPAGGGGGGGQTETESSLALVENIYIILPTPNAKSLALEWSPVRGPTWVGSVVVYKYLTRVEVTDNDKHSSFLQYIFDF